jgi:DNA-binding cell septation regulator SpoVG
MGCGKLSIRKFAVVPWWPCGLRVMKLKPFAHIRVMADHQVLAFTEATNDGCFLHIHYRLKNGTNIGMKVTLPTERKMEGAFQKFVKGESDKVITAQMEKFEKDLKVEKS